ncbi:MAG: histidine kinase, partial [Rhizobacter sp.]|nr:histidine kinase [Rhizobacter sp.]
MTAASTTNPSAWQRFSAATVRGFHAYGNWLVGISWKRFFLLSVLLLLSCAILSELPPFSWKIGETVTTAPRKAARPATKSDGAGGKPEPAEKIEEPDKGDLEITIGRDGVRIKKGRPAAASAPSAAAGSAPAAAASASERGVLIWRPRGVAEDVAREVFDELHREIVAAVEEAQRDAKEAAANAPRDVAEAARDVAQAQRDVARAKRDVEQVFVDLPGLQRKRVVHVRLGDYLPNLAMLWIVASIILKITYKGRMQAEVKAAMATETAESESLKRQVVEARMAAMQAQVEPHFLFNTLASIDHLIETDPARASIMQKNLIALLRASMPTLRETQPGAHNLGREMAVIRPYLEILKVRMEDRLQIDIDVPEGLESAEFPPMMIQSLVENAIKHGLEPKPEGGTLSVRAAISHGKLAVTVADTGLGFGKALTAGTGVGLSNIRERLKLL